MWTRVLTDPVMLQRLEGLVLSVGGVWAWLALGGAWWLLLLLFLLPDLSLLGYLVGDKVGAAAYNLVHSYPLGAVLLAAGLMWQIPLLLLAGILLLAHIGGDRALGYGLKLPTGFQDTHLGRAGR
ncbi:DUF4260 family protein [uncultured Meiothermus sp.]|jgi:hypothetical protein|uniref:DUF4260 family protein n=1 Tax=uncultured Meiothermus sp. TaxID=157471 RepID=UPI0026059981|nr:DUF4260 family protein [uncultured Meiothermus sp.]